MNGSPYLHLIGIEKESPCARGVAYQPESCILQPATPSGGEKEALAPRCIKFRQAMASEDGDEA